MGKQRFRITQQCFYLDKNNLTSNQSIKVSMIMSHGYIMSFLSLTPVCLTSWKMIFTQLIKAIKVMRDPEANFLK